MSRYTVPVMVVSMKKKGLYILCLLRVQKHLHLWAVTNMFQGDTWIFAAPDPVVVGIDMAFIVSIFEIPPTWRTRFLYLFPSGTGYPGH
jgi:hypothetical protein